MNFYSTSTRNSVSIKTCLIKRILHVVHIWYKMYQCNRKVTKGKQQPFHFTERGSNKYKSVMMHEQQNSRIRRLQYLV